MEQIFDRNTSRRKFLEFLGRASLATATLPLASSMISCTSSPVPKPVADTIPFRPIEPTWADELVLADGLQYKIILKYGDPINNRGELFGFNNDYIGYLNIPESSDLLLWVNHEYPSTIFNSGYSYFKGHKRTKEQVDQERSVVGGSFVRITQSDGLWRPVINDSLNYRMDANTKIPFAGNTKVNGSAVAIGTQGNCAGGITPWNTILTCEESIKAFYGSRDHATGEVDYYSGKDAFKDLGWWRWYNYPPEHYGWVVEVNPWNRSAKKLVSLGRFAHEGATVVEAADGRPVVYMGEDDYGGHIFKFVAAEKDSLEKGTLYAADTKNGIWLPLEWSKSTKLQKKFKSQQEVLERASEAAALLGATGHDRPEDIAIDPQTANVFIASTNNRYTKNWYGSIIKISENAADHLSLRFVSETFLSGGLDSGFACPDNFAFDPAGNFWFVTDVSEMQQRDWQYQNFKNNGLFFVPMSGKNAGQPFQVGSAPVDAELTGIIFAPDGKSIFLSVQHPGGRSESESIADLTSNWPVGCSSSPKPSVVQIFGKALEELISRS